MSLSSYESLRDDNNLKLSEVENRLLRKRLTVDHNYFKTEACNQMLSTMLKAVVTENRPPIRGHTLQTDFGNDLGPLDILLTSI
jgi:hypothetical protein